MRALVDSTVGADGPVPSASYTPKTIRREVIRDGDGRITALEEVAG